MAATLMQNMAAAGLGFSLTLAFIFFIFLLIIWEAVWKGIGLWKSARNRQVWWFVCIFIFNTLGILPIVYIAFFQKRKKK